LKTSMAVKIVGLAIVLVCSPGCVDYGRGGMHEVTFRQPGPADVHAEQEKLTELVREGLAGMGFDEMPGVPYVWRKRGVTVEVYRNEDREWMVKVRAFGTKQDVRASEKTERDLIAFLQEEPELKVSAASDAAAN
jgi:hypothetical protein